MSAETHLEVYRRFPGRLHESRLRFYPIWSSGLATALKQKKALFILYLPALIATVILSFIVYGMFTIQGMAGNEELGPGLQDLGARMLLARAEQMFQVVGMILDFHATMATFAILVVAWFASGLFCEDRKAGAHQLYFARPITRLDYFLGKFGIAAFFALTFMLVPVLVVCLMACLCSPEWSFLKDEWDVFPRAISFSLLWATVVSSVVLLASSLASRRSFALIGVFAVVFISVPVSQVLGEFVSEHLYALSLGNDLLVLSHDFFGREVEGHGSVADAWIALIALLAFSWSVIALRLRRLEVVA